MSSEWYAEMCKNWDATQWGPGATPPDPNGPEKDWNTDIPPASNENAEIATWGDEDPSEEEVEEVVPEPVSTVPTEPFRLLDLPNELRHKVLGFVIEEDDLPAIDTDRAFCDPDEYSNCMFADHMPPRDYQSVMYMLFRRRSFLTNGAHHWQDVVKNVDAIRYARCCGIENTDWKDLLKKSVSVGPVKPFWPQTSICNLMQSNKEIRENMLSLNRLYRDLVLLELSGDNFSDFIEQMYKAGIQMVVAGAISKTDTRLKARIRLRWRHGPQGQNIRRAVLRPADLIKFVELLNRLDKDWDPMGYACMIEQLECRVYLYNRIRPDKALSGLQIDKFAEPINQLEGFWNTTFYGVGDQDQVKRFFGWMGRPKNLNTYLEEFTFVVKEVEAEVARAPTEYHLELADFEKYARGSSDLEWYVRDLTLGSTARLLFRKHEIPDFDWARCMVELVCTKYLRPRILLLDRQAEEDNETPFHESAAAMYEEGLVIVKGVQWWLRELGG